EHRRRRKRLFRRSGPEMAICDGRGQDLSTTGPASWCAAVNRDESRPDFSGWWRLNLEKSTFRAQPADEILVRIHHQEPKLIQTILVVAASGEQQQTFTFDTRGIEAESSISVAGGQGRIRAHWNGAELVIETVLQGPNRRGHFADHWSLSSDGQTLRMAHIDDDLAGQVAVLARAPSGLDARFRPTKYTWGGLGGTGALSR